MITANGAVVHDHVPGPERDRVILFDFKTRLGLVGRHDVGRACSRGRRRRRRRGDGRVDLHTCSSALFRHRDNTMCGGTFLVTARSCVCFHGRDTRRVFCPPTCRYGVQFFRAKLQSSDQRWHPNNLTRWATRIGLFSIFRSIARYTRVHTKRATPV